ncbi:MAG: cadherin-like domain-containing protein, partial [Bacteroidota bacterium]
MQRIQLLLICLLFGQFVFAQKDDRLTPGLQPLDRVPALTLPAQDNDALLTEELARRGPGIAPRYAVNLAVDVDVTQHGQWEYTDNWAVVRLRIPSPTAHSINLGFSEYFMPTGGQLVLYAADYRTVRGPFTPADNEDHEQLWTPLLETDELVVEVRLPRAAKDDLRLKLAYVNHAFEDFSALISGSCNLDVICGAADGWGIVDAHRDIIQSVAVISTGGGTFCTGFLVNNVEEDCRPFFMTADHCGINSGNAPSLVTYWNYQNSSCRQPNSPASGGAGDGQLNDFNTGSIFRAARSASDFVLVELDDPISPTANAYLAGWDATASPISSAIAVHHPSTDEKRISFENDPLQFTTYGGSNPTSNFTHVRVIDWDVGTTEGGSSGSPLFDQNERVVGQLHGGGAACGNNLSDWYGSIAVSWDAGNNASARLRDWLDPANTGTLVIDGRWANDCGFNLVASPDDQSICTGQSANYTVQSSPGSGINVSLGLQGLPSGASFSFSQNTIPPGGIATLTVQTGSAVAGSYDLQVTGSGGGNTANATVTLTILPGPTNAPALATPSNGSNSELPNPILTWSGDASGATTYEVQIATNSNFTSLVETGTTNSTAFQPTFAGDALTTYYWRVRASNSCGTSAFSSAWSFTTQNITCITYRSQFSTTISENGTPSITNNITVPDDDEIALVQVGLDITHTYVGDLAATLLSPTSSVISLLDRPGVPNSSFGCSQDNILVNFSNNAVQTASDFDNTCNNSTTGDQVPGPPHAIAGSFQPIGDLNMLQGSSSNGTWTLELNDNADQDGGILEEWSLTICYEVPSPPPALSVNSILSVPHSDQRIVTNTHLQATDANSTPAELVYTIQTLPQEGVLQLNGITLGVNGTFTQADIDNGNLSYVHGGGMVLQDDFEFDLSNAAGVTLEDNVFQIEITVAPMMVTVAQTATISCANDASAAITASVSGGLSPYTYQLNNQTAQGSNIFNNLTAGTYLVQVEDALGDVVSSTNLSITEPSSLNAAATVTDDDVTVNASGGTPTYSYQINGGTSQTSPTFTDLPNGTYDFLVTDSQGCTTTATATVLVNTLAASASINNGLSCHDATDASLTANVTGGTMPFTYALNDGTPQNSPTFNNLGPGTYTVTVQDADGFTSVTNDVTITAPAALTGSTSVTGFDITVNAAG